MSMHPHLFFIAALLVGTGCTTAPSTWVIDSSSEWHAALEAQEGAEIADATVGPRGDVAHVRSAMRSFGAPRRLKSITIEPAPSWLNWEPVANVGPANLRDAPVLLARGKNDYWMFGRFGAIKKTDRESFVPRPVRLEGFDGPLLTTPLAGVYDAPGGLQEGLGGYHAWQSRDMQTWVHHGPVTEKFSRWVTSAEAVAGSVYIYYDYPNDQDPHVYRDDDLTDGRPGENLGLALADPSHGSDTGFIRALDGRFHAYFEDWSPIEASKRSWDSPLAGHAVSTGPQGFVVQGAAIDHRTQPTGEVRTYLHPHWDKHPDWDTSVGEYAVHEPEQPAYGDWAPICIGGRTWLFGDYDPARGHAMACGWFTSATPEGPFEWCGKIGQGHPDPDVAFAEGRFWLVTQQKTDWVSPGPWVERVEVRVGVDTTDDGVCDAWTEWQEVRERYDHIPGFSKQIARTPARRMGGDIPPGHGFRFELRLTDKTENESRPVIDALTMSFED